MQRERKLAALRRALKDSGWAKGAEASFFCASPKGCNGQHHKRKLAINLERDVFHCWVCGWKGASLLPLLKRLGEGDRDYIDYLAEHERPKDEKKKDHDKVKLPPGFRPLCVDWKTPYYNQAKAYLHNRGIDEDDILTYKLGYCEEGKYADRVIIPSFDEYGELNFFVGRGIWQRVQPTYLTGKFDKDIIFNDLLVDWSKPVTLVEGPFDAFKVGTNAIPLQGKYLLERLKDKLIARKPQVLIALDSDALADSLRIAEELISYGVEVGLVTWSQELKDPGDMSKKQFAKFAEHPKRIAGPTDILRLKAFHSASMHA